MLFKDVITVIQGSILTRIKSIDNNGIECSSLTMQGLSYFLNLTDINEEENIILVSTNKINSCCFAKKGDVVIGLSSGKAMPIEDENNGKLVLSNFALLKCSENKNIDPYYLSWYINENPDIQKIINSSIQGSSRVRILPMSMINEFPIELIAIESQKIIGKIYDLNRRKVRINRFLEEKKSDLNLAYILKFYKGEKTNE